jgi:hypothetical protein
VREAGMAVARRRAFRDASSEMADTNGESRSDPSMDFP